VSSVTEHGRDAETPTEIPARGWKDVQFRVKAEAKDDELPFLAGGVAFFALIALVPALIAVVSLFGLVADPGEVQRQVADTLAGAPAEVRDLAATQLRSITESSDTGLGIGLVVGIVLALWSASAGMANLISALNRVYDERETRKFVRKRGLALLLTLGAILAVTIAFAVVALLPAAVADSELGTVARWTVSILRWPALAVGFILGLAVLYRLAPDRRDAGWRWLTPGALVATVLWIAGSLLFSLYTASFASYNETYGALGAVVITMLWLQLTAFAILIGAEVNAELERQTAEDSTRGPEKPLGRRGAVVADDIGPTAEQVKAQAKGAKQSA
jgi:membrane protein